MTTVAVLVSVWSNSVCLPCRMSMLATRIPVSSSMRVQVGEAVRASAVRAMLTRPLGTDGRPALLCWVPPLPHLLLPRHRCLQGLPVEVHAQADVRDPSACQCHPECSRPAWCDGAAGADTGEAC